MGDFLASVARERRIRLDREAGRVPTAELRQRAESYGAPPRPFAARLRRAPGVPLRVIAELKRASPSAGVLREPYDPAGLASRYAAAGASALSVLTEPARFQGSVEHLSAVRERVALPILCKDFVVHERQIYEARAYGADAILLIVALLEPSQLRDYAHLAREIGLDRLVEVFEERELERALATDAAIGINNRDLRTLAVDPARAERLLPLVPGDRVRVAESGYRTRGEIEALERIGADAVLVGETLLRAASIEETFAELFGSAPWGTEGR